MATTEDQPLFTFIKSAICFTTCCCDSGDEDDKSITNSDLRPLLDRSPPPTMPRQIRYGKNTPAHSVAASRIFGSATPASTPSSKSSNESRGPLFDITLSLSNLLIGSGVQPLDETSSDKASNVSDESGISEAVNFHAILQNEELAQIKRRHKQPFYDRTECESIGSSDSPDEIALKPLIDAYKADCDRRLPIEDWEHVLHHNSQVIKIAEASYAEVYRVQLRGKSSILKVMQLKLPSDPESLTRDTAIEVTNVISEMRIMNALTEIPGFVIFKDAHIVKGIPCKSFIKAYEECTKWNSADDTSYFPHPSDYVDESVFLVIELGDAGEVLEDFPVRDIGQLFDILLGTIMALARAEIVAQFEHRDLHENNICIAYKDRSEQGNSNTTSKLGRSGLEVTILDYGLSRATLKNGEVVFNDLEKDLSVFRGDSCPQFNAYRQMRTHLFTGERGGGFSKAWHVSGSERNSNGHTWKEFTPYTNVLWVRYVYGCLKEIFIKSGGDSKDLAHFEIETRELAKKLNPRTLETNGAFLSAQDVAGFVFDQGWVTPEQLHGNDSSVLSQEPSAENE